MELPPPPMGSHPIQPPLPSSVDLDGMASTGKIGLAGAAALLVGSFLAWVQATTVFGSLTVNGFDGDGKLTAAAGGASAFAMFAGINKASRKSFTAAAVFAALGGAVALYQFNNISSAAADVSNEYVQAKVGVGIYVCCIGAVVAVLAGLMARNKAPAEASDGGATA